jgi:hypothetical protein
MSVFKPFSSQDVIVTPFMVHKRLQFTGDVEFVAEGIDIYTGELKPPTNFEVDQEDNSGKFWIRNTRSVYDSIKQLYYSNYTNDQQVASGSYNNFLTSLIDDIRVLPQIIGSEVNVISIPQRLYGDYIKPTSFKYNWIGGEIFDDGEGNVYSPDGAGGKIQVGNIIYSHGLIVVTQGIENGDGSLRTSQTGSSAYGSASYGDSDSVYGGPITSFRNFTFDFTTDPNAIITLDSSHTIFESQYKCTVRESEFNYSYNPSLLSGSSTAETGSGEYKSLITGSDFSPYATTIGLYNNNQELLAIGKLAQPLPLSTTTDTTILINLDR